MAIKLCGKVIYEGPYGFITQVDSRREDLPPQSHYFFWANAKPTDLKLAAGQFHPTYESAMYAYNSLLMADAQAAVAAHKIRA